MLGKGGLGFGCTVRDETRENQGHRQDLGARFNTHTDTFACTHMYTCTHMHACTSACRWYMNNGSHLLPDSLIFC